MATTDKSYSYEEQLERLERAKMAFDDVFYQLENAIGYEVQHGHDPKEYADLYAHVNTAYNAVDEFKSAVQPLAAAQTK